MRELVPTSHRAGRNFGIATSSANDRREIALLGILIATGEKALEAFHASNNPVDETFVADLERIMQRSREELAALTAETRDAPT